MNNEIPLEEVENQQSVINVEQKNSFKVTKNTKGYNYEFKIIEDDLELLKKKVLELNAWAKENFKNE